MWSLLIAFRRHGVSTQRVLAFAYQIGVNSLPILLVISAFIGTNLALQGYLAFKPLGGERLVGMFVALAGVRELAPVIAASMVAAKAGTEMASQIGVMRIDEQIDALEVMAVNPLAHMVLPRAFGITLVMPALTIIAIFTMLCGAYLTSTLQLGLNDHTFIEMASNNTNLRDFLWCSIKAVVFGGIISTVSCWFGFACDRSPRGVGQATNRAVVASAVVCVCMNYIISEVLYGGM